MLKQGVKVFATALQRDYVSFITTRKMQAQRRKAGLFSAIKFVKILMLKRFNCELENVKIFVLFFVIQRSLVFNLLSFLKEENLLIPCLADYAKIRMDIILLNYFKVVVF